MCISLSNFLGRVKRGLKSGSIPGKYPFGNEREQIVDKFAKGNPVLDVEETSYDDFQSESYTLTETTGISITSENDFKLFQ